MSEFIRQNGQHGENRSCRALNYFQHSCLYQIDAILRCRKTSRQRISKIQDTVITMKGKVVAGSAPFQLACHFRLGKFLVAKRWRSELYLLLVSSHGGVVRAAVRVPPRRYYEYKNDQKCFALIFN